jgi:hypothetical protein
MIQKSAPWKANRTGWAEVGGLEGKGLPKIRHEAQAHFSKSLKKMKGILQVN